MDSASGGSHQMVQHRLADPTAQSRVGRAHRLHLAVTRFQTLQGATAQEQAVFAQGEEPDVWVIQPVDGKHMASVWRRSGPHLGKMLVEQHPHIVMVQLAFEKLPVHRHLV